MKDLSHASSVQNHFSSHLETWVKFGSALLNDLDPVHYSLYTNTGVKFWAAVWTWLMVFSSIYHEIIVTDILEYRSRTFKQEFLAVNNHNISLRATITSVIEELVM